MALPRLRRRRSVCRRAAAALKRPLVLSKLKKERAEEEAAERESRGHEKERTEEEAAEHRGQEETLSLGALPQDLAIAVLMRLPLRSLVQMRLLSTSFNACLRSPPFELCSQLPWLIMVKVGDAGPDMRVPREFIAYCPNLKSWFRLPIQGHSGLLSAMGGPGLLQVPSVQSSSPLLSSLAMASSGGLMCTVVTALRPEAERQQAPPPPKLSDCDVDGYLSDCVMDRPVQEVLVFNCFTGASKRLPPPPPHYSSLTTSSTSFLSNNLPVHMFLDVSAPGAYYVVLNHCNRPNVPTYIALSIYSSRTGCWMDGHANSARPYPCTFGDIRKSDLFSYDCDRHAGSGTLIAYAIRSDSWLSIPIIPVEEPGSWPSVFKWQGRVFLATSLTGASFKVCVLTSSSRWSDSATWVEVARTPASLVQSFAGNVMRCDYKFVLCGNLVCMTRAYSGIFGYPGRRYRQPLVYDLAGDFWYYLPPSCIKGTTTDFGAALLAFQPHLQATP